MTSAPSSQPKESFYLIPIGETGAGKTTLINSFANYSRYATLDEAIENGPAVLADVGFTYSAADVKRKPVYLRGSASGVKEGADVSGATHTQGSSVYSFDSNDSEELIFYDNPGFGSHSLQQGEKIKKPVHAICIVLKPDDTRLHTELRNFLETEGKLLVNNIVYCFTNTRAHFFQPAATLTTLRDFLLDLEGTVGVEFPTKKENIFCFENDCFRYLCYLSANPGDQSRHHRVYARGWTTNVEEYKRLISHVKTLTPVPHEEVMRPDIVMGRTNFRDLLPVPRRPVVDLLIKQKEWPVLKEFISAESEEVQQAFEIFMKSVDDSRDPQLPSEETLAVGLVQGNSIGFNRPRYQGQRFRNSVGRQTAEKTIDSSDHEVSNLSCPERLAADIQLVSISSSPSSEAQIQDNHPAEVLVPAVRAPGRYEKNEIEARNETNCGSIRETLTEAGDNTRYPNMDRTFNRDISSLTQSELSATAFHSLNSQPNQSSLQQEQDTEQETRVKQDFDTDGIPQEVYNVLLLGETGVGKTTFINSCANYIKFCSMEEALDKGPEILMDSTFTASEAVGTVKITVRATTGETGARNSTSEHTEQAGESRTQEPLIHKMTWIAEDGRRKLLRIIDTPGVNDTRGQDQDDINFKMVLQLIQRIGTLHAICLLLKPNESIISAGFRRSLDYFLTRLHSSAPKNILFCFTNTRSTFHQPGETYTLLEKYFKDLKAANGIEITLNSSNVFCFENDCFRYMCLLMNGRNRVNKHYEQVTKSWKHNVPEVRKFLERIQHLNPHLTQDTTKMDTVSELLSELARPLMETMQSLVYNHQQAVQLKKKINLSTREGELWNMIHTKKSVLNIRFLQQPQLICTAVSCSSFYYLNDRTVVDQPSKPCHDLCQISTSNGLCVTCHCHKDFHQHISYEIYYGTKDIIDEDVFQRFVRCRSKTEQKRLMLGNLDKTLNQLDSEVIAIKSACAEFSAFLLYSSLKAGADPYRIYLDIWNERDKQAGNKLCYQLEDILKQHNHDVQLIVQSVRTGQQLKLTYDQIVTKIDYLRSLPSSGRLFSEIVERIAKSAGRNGDQQIDERM